MRRPKHPRFKKKPIKTNPYPKGAVEAQGDPQVAGLLSTILGGHLDLEGSRAHIHGFGTYAGRMHPSLARRAIELMCPKGGVVLDPFCGSGTVLVEAKLAARSSMGIDISPFSVLLSRVKTHCVSEGDLRALVATAARMSRHAQARRKERRGSTRRYPTEDTQRFEPHVLLELDGLVDGLEDLRSGLVRDALWVVFSDVLLKVSRVGDSPRGAQVDRRLAAGFTIGLFEKISGELVRRLGEYGRLLPVPVVSSSVVQGDARELVDVKEGSVDLVLSLPPNLGIFDYLEHHRTRLRWLGLGSETMVEREIGARRHFISLRPMQAMDRFGEQMNEVFEGLRGKLSKGGRVVLVVADSTVGGQPVWMDEWMRSRVSLEGFRWMGTASRLKSHAHPGSKKAFVDRPRREHMMLWSAQ